MRHFIINRFFAAALSFISVFAINRYFFNSALGYKNSIINLFLFVMILLLSLWDKNLLPGTLTHSLLYSERHKLIQKYVLIFSVTLSVLLILGNAVNTTTTLEPVFASPGDFLLSFIETVGFIHLFSVILSPFLQMLLNVRPVGGGKEPWYFSNDRRSIFVLWGLIFLCWLPVWLAYFPGIFSYDAYYQLIEIIGESPLNNHYPLLHTFFLALCFRVGWLFGGNTAGLVIYSIAQMILMSFMFSYALWRLADMKLSRNLRLLILVCFALNPVSSVFSFVPIKDVPLGGIFVLFTISLADLLRDSDAFFQSKKKAVGLSIWSLLLCLLRNNLLYALILFLVITIFIIKTNRRKILFTFGAAILAAVIITGPLLSAFHILEPRKAEALSIPIQQIALTYINHKKELSSDDREAIDILIPIDIAGEFNPRLADPIKFMVREDEFDFAPVKYIKLWGRLLVQYPADYINAALNLNLAYWYPDTMQPDPYSNRPYLETYIWPPNYGMERHSVFPGLLKLYEGLVSEDVQQNLPVVAVFYNIGTPIWFVFFCIMLCFAKGRKQMSILLLPAVTLWLTFMLGPVANLRYMFPLIVCCPVYFGLILQLPARAAEKKDRM